MDIDSEIFRKFEKISSDMQAMANEFSRKNEESIKRINLHFQAFAKNTEQARLRIRPFLEQMQAASEKITQNQHFQLWARCKQAGLNLHPMFTELFVGQFDQNILQKDWRKIRAYLWRRRSVVLIGSDGENRYKQLLSAQTAKAYIAVCRATYAEIESLVRDELFKDEDFLKKYSEKNNAGKRRRYTSSKVGNIMSSKGNKKSHSIWGIDGDKSIHEVGIYTWFFVTQLEECFNSFDPDDAQTNIDDSQNLNRNRHFHAHGWSKSATFIDGLNALLLLDLTMNVLGEKEERRD